MRTMLIVIGATLMITAIPVRDSPGGKMPSFWLDMSGFVALILAALMTG